ncbi:ArsR/SmtB family transcription factor [Candidatus Nanohalococcus occultus]|uniref:Transcriptional regulator containing HTH domain,ArsR family n=1 Tax=Candidatus Nanohalococcus occultus TaxID=2978047 RepID=A0ABY8CIQ2_9ARCH|nr:Transcriptional regulator containing HTH domain,ArsR family [Candidatus Nanohaloarchaeota archaeon SVXNc]
MRAFRDNGDELQAEELNSEQLEALSNQIRQQIVTGLAEKPMYPAQAARKYGLSKQRAHYHFKKLEKSGLISKTGQTEKSGGKADIYSPAAQLYYYDTGADGKKAVMPDIDEDVQNFLGTLVDGRRIEGVVVAGSADQHGPDQVRARDGHLTAEITAKLGNYGRFQSRSVALDTEVSRDGSYEQNIFILGGVLTNTVAKKFNEQFPAKFTGKEFPYREISTPENTYTEPNIGVITKTENPENSEKTVFMAAGVRNQGTEAATRAFHDLEEIAPELVEKHYLIVRGLDNDGDGRIDGYEVIE